MSDQAPTQPDQSPPEAGDEDDAQGDLGIRH
jgi:hypothetical protein